MIPTTARGQETRARLLSAAEKVFGQKSYFQVSIADITREAGTGNGTFYLYFPSKETVFRELVEQRAHELRMMTHVAAKAGSNRVEAEHQGFSAFFQFIQQHQDLYRIVRQAEFVDPELFRTYYRTFAEGYATALTQAMERGEIARLDPEVLAYCLMGIGDFSGMRWVLWTGRPIGDAAFDDIMAFIEFGLRGRGSRATEGGGTEHVGS